MSLMNQVLKDLEKQKKSQGTSGFSQYGYPPSRSSSKTKTKIVFVLLLGAALAYVILNVETLFDVELIDFQTKQIPLKLPKSSAQLMVPSTGRSEQTNQLKSMSVQQHGKRLEILMTFDEPVQYALLEDLKQKQLSVELPNVFKSNVDQKSLESATTLQWNIIDHAKSGHVLSFKHTKDAHLSALIPEQNTLRMQFEVDQPTASVKAVMHKVIKPLSAKQRRYSAYHDALDAIEHGDPQKGAQRLTHLLTNYPGFLQARLSLAKLYLEQHKTALAKRVVLNGLHQLPENIELIQLKAKLLLAEHQTQAALTELLKHTPPLMYATDYYALLAASYKQLDRYQDAARVYAQLLKFNPNQGVWWVGLGLCLEQLEKNNEALSAYQKSLEVGHLTPSLSAFSNTRLQALRG